MAEIKNLDAFLEEAKLNQQKPFNEYHDIFSLLSEKEIWTNEEDKTIMFLNKVYNNAYSSLTPFERGCSLILLMKSSNPKRQYDYIMLTPKVSSFNTTNSWFDGIVKAFNGEVVENIECKDTSLEFPQRGPHTSTKGDITIDIYTFTPDNIDMKRLKRLSPSCQVYTSIHNAPTAIAAFDRKYYWNNVEKYLS